MVDSPSKTRQSNSSSPLKDEFQIKQIRLTKRQDPSPASPPTTPTEEFQMRPIRLGSRNRSVGGGSGSGAPTGSAVSTGGSSHSKSDSISSMYASLDPTIQSSQTPLHSRASSFSSTISRKHGISILGDVTSNPPLQSPPELPEKREREKLNGSPSAGVQIKSLPIEKRRPNSINFRGHGHSRGDSLVSPLDSQFGLECHDKIFAVCLVNFHHLRGPEVQYWKSNYFPTYSPKLFKNLPFQALPDGSHLFQETFSNFNLSYDFSNGELLDDGDDIKVYNSQIKNMKTLKTLFGCSCVQQVKTSDLSQEEMDRNKDITRSIVQKAVVVICRKQPIFNKIKEKLSIITGCYFQQGDFNDFEILDLLFYNLNDIFTSKPKSLNLRSGDSLHESESELPPPSLDYTYEKVLNEERLKNEREDEYFVNLDLKKSILKFSTNFLIIFKSLILEKKVIVYSNNNLELLTQFQNTLILLIPNLINNLDLAGCPLLDYTEIMGPLGKPSSLNTNNRHSMLRFFGMPLQIFNTKGSFWNPYLPLQQLSELSGLQSKSYMIGCSNLLFVNQLELLGVDVLINLDLAEITYPSNKSSRPEDLGLTTFDKKFMNSLIGEIKTAIQQQKSLDKKEQAFLGSDDYIRYQFEDYVLSLLSTTRYNQYVEKFNSPPPGFNNTNNSGNSGHANDHDDWSASLDVETNNIHNGNLTLFNKKFIETWIKTANFKIWNSMADEFVFNFLDPKHIAAGQSHRRSGSGVNGDDAYLSGFLSGFKRLTSGSYGNQSPEAPSTPITQKFIPKEVDRIVPVVNKLPQRIVSVKMRSDERIVPVTLQGGKNIVPVKLGGDNDDKNLGKKLSNWWYKKK